MSKAILISDKASANAKPELEIYADDVVCAHGATVGELDDEQLFYLNSRGIAMDKAREILIKAFLEDIVIQSVDEPLHDFIFNEANTGLSSIIKKMKSLNNDKYDVNKIKAQFPALNRTVWDKPLVYLDSAASMQKPQRVLDAINKNYSFNYSNVHRGLHKLSEEATSNYEGARRKIANFINCNEKEVIFTSGATAAINLIAYSWGLKNLSPGDEIIITIAEHHANIVPWQIIAEQKDVKIIAAKINPNEDFDAEIIKELVTDKTKIIAFPHVSNVLGTVFPVKEICKIASDCGAISVVDGCQGVIHGKVDVVELTVIFIVFLVINFMDQQE